MRVAPCAVPHCAPALARQKCSAYVIHMLNILSIFVGLVALVFALPGLIPLLGWLNWLAVFIGVIGLAIGALSSHNAGRNLNIAVLIVAAIRLTLGGGFF